MSGHDGGILYFYLTFVLHHLCITTIHNSNGGSQAKRVRDVT